MAEELQSLIERIQRDGINKAEADAQRIVSEAERRAAAIQKAAEERAAGILAQAEKDAQQYGVRADKALEQAARDVVLSVHQAVTASLQSLVSLEVGAALAADTLPNLLVKLVEAYWAQQGDGAGLDVLVGPADQKVIADYFLQRYREALDRGVEIKADGTVLKGFRVAVAGGDVHHDFTQAAIAEALGRLLQPRLAALVKRSAPGA